MYRIGFMLALLVASTSQDGPQTKGMGLGALTGFATAALGNVNKIFFDKVDVNSIFNSAIGEVTRRLGTGSCIAGLYLNVDNNDMTLKLTDGKLSDLHMMVVRVKTVKEDPDTLTVSISFVFPRLPIIYAFDYSSVRVFTKVERDGHVELKQDGPATVEIIATLPKSQKKVDEALTRDKCVANIQDVKVTVDKELHTLKVNYDSYAKYFGMQVTESSVKGMLKGLKEELQDNEKAALRQLIEPVFRGNALNCKDATYTAPVGGKGERAVDCRHFNIAKKYKPQPQAA